MVNLGIKESLTIELKSDKSCLPDSDIIDAVVAFANTDGGDLYLGVEDDGEITGLHKKHLDTSQLSAFIANKTVPPVPVRLEVLELAYPVLKISVTRRTSIVASSSGKILRRRLKADGTPENVPLYPYEIASRLSSLSLLDYSAQPVPDSVYTDLDPLERQRIRNIIGSYRGESALLELDDEALDKALQFVTIQDGQLTPTFCGLLMIGQAAALKRHMPTAEASIQILTGTEIRVNESFFLPILAAFEKITAYFNAWNSSKELEIGLFRLTIPDYDTRAFREALVNAFCHRDYSQLGRVRVQLSDEGMTIANPGGFIEGINADNLLEAEPHGRNSVLADAMKRIGLAERTGRGIDRIYEGSLLYGRLLPDYARSTAVSVSLFIPKGPTDAAFIQLIAQEQQRQGRSLPIYSLLVLNSLKELSRASVQEVADHLKIAESRVRSSLEALAAAGIIEAGGNGRGRYYLLGAKYYQQAHKASEYIRRRDIDTLRHEELVLQLARQQGTLSRKDVVDLLHITPTQAYRLLQKLVQDEKMTLTGKGGGARYLLK